MELQKTQFSGCNTFTRGGVAVIHSRRGGSPLSSYILIAGKHVIYIYKYKRGTDELPDASKIQFHTYVTLGNASALQISTESCHLPSFNEQPVFAVLSSERSILIVNAESGTIIYALRVLLSYLQESNMMKLSDYMKGISSIDLVTYVVDKAGCLYFLVLLTTPQGCLYAVECLLKNRREGNSPKLKACIGFVELFKDKLIEVRTLSLAKPLDPDKAAIEDYISSMSLLVTLGHTNGKTTFGNLKHFGRILKKQSESTFVWRDIGKVKVPKKLRNTIMKHVQVTPSELKKMMEDLNKKIRLNDVAKIAPIETTKIDPFVSKSKTHMFLKQEDVVQIQKNELFNCVQCLFYDTAVLCTCPYFAKDAAEANVAVVSSKAIWAVTDFTKERMFSILCNRDGADAEFTSATLYQDRPFDADPLLIVSSYQRMNRTSIICMHRLSSLFDNDEAPLFTTENIRGKVLSIRALPHEYGVTTINQYATPFVVYNTDEGGYGVVHTIYSDSSLFSYDINNISFFDSFKLYDNITSSQVETMLAKGDRNGNARMLSDVCIACWHPCCEFLMESYNELNPSSPLMEPIPILVVGTLSGALRFIGGKNMEYGILYEHVYHDGPVLDVKFLREKPYLLASTGIDKKTNIIQIAAKKETNTKNKNDIIDNNSLSRYLPSFSFTSPVEPAHALYPISSFNWCYNSFELGEYFILVGSTNGSGAIFTFKLNKKHASWSSTCSFSSQRGPITSIQFVNTKIGECQKDNTSGEFSYPVISASVDTSLKLWTFSKSSNRASYSGEFVFHKLPITALYVHKMLDNLVLSADSGGTIAVWDTSSVLKRARNDGERSEKQLISSGSSSKIRSLIGDDKINDIAMNKVDVGRSYPLFTIKAHSCSIINLGVSSNSAFSIVSQGSDGITKTWSFSSFLFPLSRFDSILYSALALNMNYAIQDVREENISTDMASRAAWNMNDMLKSSQAIAMENESIRLCSSGATFSFHSLRTDKYYTNLLKHWCRGVSSEEAIDADAALKLYYSDESGIEKFIALLKYISSDYKDVSYFNQSLPSLPKWLVLLLNNKVEEAIATLLGIAGVSMTEHTRAYLRRAAIESRGCSESTINIPRMFSYPENTITKLKRVNLNVRWIEITLLALLIESYNGRNSLFMQLLKLMPYYSSKGINVGPFHSSGELQDNVRRLESLIGSTSIDTLVQHFLVTHLHDIPNDMYFERFASLMVGKCDYDVLKTLPYLPLVPHILIFHNKLLPALTIMKAFKSHKPKYNLRFTSLILIDNVVHIIDVSRQTDIISYPLAQRLFLNFDGFDSINTAVNILTQRGSAKYSESLYLPDYHVTGSEQLYSLCNAAMTAIDFGRANQTDGFIDMLKALIKKITHFPSLNVDVTRQPFYNQLQNYLNMHKSDSGKFTKLVEPFSIATFLGIQPQSFALAYLTLFCESRLLDAFNTFASDKLALGELVKCANELATIINTCVTGLRIGLEEEGLEGLTSHLACLSWLVGGITAISRSKLAIECNENDAVQDSVWEESSDPYCNEQKEVEGHVIKPNLILVSPSLCATGQVMLKLAYEHLKRCTENTEGEGRTGAKPKALIESYEQATNKVIEPSPSRQIPLFPTHLPLGPIEFLLSYLDVITSQSEISQDVSLYVDAYRKYKEEFGNVCSFNADILSPQTRTVHEQTVKGRTMQYDPKCLFEWGLYSPFMPPNLIHSTGEVTPCNCLVPFCPGALARWCV